MSLWSPLISSTLHTYFNFLLVIEVSLFLYKLARFFTDWNFFVLWSFIFLSFNGNRLCICENGLVFPHYYLFFNLVLLISSSASLLLVKYVLIFTKLEIASCTSARRGHSSLISTLAIMHVHVKHRKESYFFSVSLWKEIPTHFPLSCNYSNCFNN